MDTHPRPLVSNAKSILSFCRYRLDAYIGLPAKTLLENHPAFCKCKQGMVTANTYVFTCIMPGSPLTHNNASAFGQLTAEKLNPETLALGVTAVF